MGAVASVVDVVAAEVDVWRLSRGVALPWCEFAAVGSACAGSHQPEHGAGGSDGGGSA